QRCQSAVRDPHSREPAEERRRVIQVMRFTWAAAAIAVAVPASLLVLGESEAGGKADPPATSAEARVEPGPAPRANPAPTNLRLPQGLRGSTAPRLRFTINGALE